MTTYQAAVFALLTACGSAAERGDTSSTSSRAGSSPAITEAACEGEECQAEFPAVACRTVMLVVSPAKFVGAIMLQRGDTVDVRSDLHLIKPGIVVLKRDHTQPDEWNTGMGTMGATEPPPLKFAAGDTLRLLNYIGEGFWKGQYKGREMEVLEFWGGPGQAELGPDDAAQAAIAIGTAPVIDTWLRISQRGREIGWWKKDTTNAIVPIGEYGRKRGLACPGGADFSVSSTLPDARLPDQHGRQPAA